MNDKAEDGGSSAKLTGPTTSNSTVPVFKFNGITCNCVTLKASIQGIMETIKGNYS